MAIKIVIKKPAIPKEKSTGTKLTIGTKPKVQKIPVEPVQKFFITHNEKSLMIKFQDMSFGIKLNDNRIEVEQRNTPAKENEGILKILKLIKDLKKSNVSFSDIATRLQVAIYATSIKAFNNRLAKPVEETTN